MDAGAAAASEQTDAFRRLSVLVTDSARRARLTLHRVCAVPCPWRHPFTSPAGTEPCPAYACAHGEAALLLVAADGRVGMGMSFSCRGSTYSRVTPVYYTEATLGEEPCEVFCPTCRKCAITRVECALPPPWLCTVFAMRPLMPHSRQHGAHGARTASPLALSHPRCACSRLCKRRQVPGWLPWTICLTSCICFMLVRRSCCSARASHATLASVCHPTAPCAAM
jgi:hypothetical protein